MYCLVFYDNKIKKHNLQSDPKSKSEAIQLYNYKTNYGIRFDVDNSDSYFYLKPIAICEDKV